MSTDIWGFCRDCARWFFCEGWFDKTAPEPCCPVCGSEPTAIVNRAASRASVLSGNV